MRFDQLNGWQLLAIQAGTLALVTPLLWGLGAMFRRSRVARALTVLLAPAIGGLAAFALLRADEVDIASYLFATCLFLIGTVMMATILLAAIPQARHAAIGATLAGALMVIAFVLTYWLVFSFGAPHWLQTAARASTALALPRR
jgi:hypothetical protein